MSWLKTDEHEWVNTRYLKIISVEPDLTIHGPNGERIWNIQGIVDVDGGERKVLFGSYYSLEEAFKEIDNLPIGKPDYTQAEIEPRTKKADC